MTFDYAAIADLLDRLPALLTERREELGITQPQMWAQDPSVSLSTYARFERLGVGSKETYQAALRFLARHEPAGPGPAPDRPTPDTPDGSR